LYCGLKECFVGVAATVLGRVFEDTDGNGVQDKGEPGLRGVVVVVTDSAGVLHTVTTDHTGAYSVTVVPGSTTADVDERSLPSGYIQTSGTDPSSALVSAGASTDMGSDGYQSQGPSRMLMLVKRGMRVDVV
jgi:hypothetical protein